MNDVAKIETASGRAVNLLDPDPETIVLSDIALGLARQSRFAGQCFRYYSVAEHSLLSLALARGYLEQPVLGEEIQRAVFMHDAHEAFLRDFPAPLKKYFTEYEVLVDKLDEALGVKFSIESFSLPEIKKIDAIALSIEAWRLMPCNPENWTSPLDPSYRGITLDPIELRCGDVYYPDKTYGSAEAYELFLSEAKAIGL